MTKVQKWFAKLRNRIFFSFVGCFLGIMLLIMGVFQFSSQKYFSQLAVSSTRRELASITDNLESTLQHVINFSISASINDEIIRIARTYPTLPGSEAEQYAVRKKINTIINAIIALSPNIAMWDIMAKDGSFFQAGGYNLSELDSFDKEQIMKQHQNARQAMITGPYFYLPARETLKENGKYVFLISKPIVDLNTRETYGYLMFFIEASTIASPFVNYRPNNSEVTFYITDQENTILLASDLNYTGKTIREAFPFSKRDVENLETQDYLTKENVVYCSTQMSLPDWKLIHVIPMDELMKEQHLFARIFFICNLLVILFFALLSWWNARAISGPILDLSEVMKNVVKEAYAPVEVPGTSEEIQILYRGYNIHLPNRHNSFYKPFMKKNVKKMTISFG